MVDNDTASTNKKTFLTPVGLQKLEEELQDLLENRRPEVAVRIAQAKEYGDLSENSEYEAAKEEQAFVEGRIAQLQQMIKNAVIISDMKPHDTVELGSTVVLDEGGIHHTYIIVGSAEADPISGRISNESPLGQALMGRKKGDIVVISVPAGKREVEILEIR